MIMPIAFTEGSLDNLTEIVELNHEIFSGMYEDEPYSLKHYRKELSDKNTVIYLARDGQKLVGASISFEREGGLYVWIMGTLRDYRRRGIATTLLKFNEDYARKNDLKSITTRVYNVSREMQRLLKRRGYQVDVSKTDEKHHAKRFRLVFLSST